MAAPPEKKQRTEESVEEEKPAEDAEMKEAAEVVEKPADEKPKVPEPPKELETDAVAITPKDANKDGVGFFVHETTLNVLTSGGGNVLMSMNEGGIQHLIAGARANVGITGGRYLFEVKVLEFVNVMDANAQASANLRQKNVVRVGFSTAASSLILGSSAESVCFDSDGCFTQNKNRSITHLRFGRESIVGVLLNLEEGHPNCNTVSLFKDGRRMTQPQQLPEGLRGKELFPHVSWKNASVHVNFGPAPLAPLPFTCHMVQEGHRSHVSVKVPPESPKDNKYDVVFPVSLPDQGTFDWLEMFLEKRPTYTELSDRMILEWAEQSGIGRTKSYRSWSSNDKPEMAFAVRDLDDGSVRRAVYSIAPLLKRHFVVMEVKSNLVPDERRELIKQFPAASFKRMAYVIMGDANMPFKKRTQEKLLKKKQEEADRAFELQKLEVQRKKLLEQRAKEIERQRKAVEKAKRKAERQAKRAAEEALKKAEEEKKKAENAGTPEDGENKEDGEKKDDGEKKEDGEKEDGEEKKEEPKPMDDSSEEEEEPEEAEDDTPMEPPKVELTADDKKIQFIQHDIKDLTPQAFSISFAKYALPSADEGFDQVQYEWFKEKKAEEFLKTWITEKKLTTRVEDLRPSTWFEKRHQEWLVKVQQYRQKVIEFEQGLQRKAAERAAKRARVLAKKAQQEAKKLAEEKAAAEKAEKEKAEDGKEAEKKEDGAEEKKEEAAEEEKPKAAEEEEEKKEEEEEAEEEDEEEVDIDKAVGFNDVDVFGTPDILDIGKGMPLFKAFKFEDWAMLSLRFELYLLVHAFRKDVNDPERFGIHMEHLPFYYNRYYKKNLNYKDFGVETATELTALVNDTVGFTPRSVLETYIEEEIETPAIFVKLTEEARRLRMLRLDLGEDVALKIQTHNFHAGGYKPNNGKGWGQKGGFSHGKGIHPVSKGGQPAAGGADKGSWGKGQQTSYSGSIHPVHSQSSKGGSKGYQQKGGPITPPAPAGAKGSSGYKGPPVAPPAPPSKGYQKGATMTPPSAPRPVAPRYEQPAVPPPPSANYGKAQDSKGSSKGYGYQPYGKGKDSGKGGKYSDGKYSDGKYTDSKGYHGPKGGYQDSGKGYGKSDYSKGDYSKGYGKDYGKSDYSKGYGKGGKY